MNIGPAAAGPAGPVPVPLLKGVPNKVMPRELLIRPLLSRGTDVVYTWGAVLPLIYIYIYLVRPPHVITYSTHAHSLVVSFPDLQASLYYL